ncbi:MAG: hypothetical protein Kow0099_24740 [Candidatus Abyssubacteria bacterium]
MPETLAVILGCDCDPDRPGYGGARYDIRHPSQRWTSLTDGVSSLLTILQRVENVCGVKPRVVFCLRSDSQMKEIYGSASWAIEEFAGTWRRLEAEGHELAWHPHLWRWHDDSNCWLQEAEDTHWILECLEEGFSQFRRALGKNPVTSHSGWTFHNNTTMAKLSELGIKVDFSACPGVFFQGGPNKDGTRFDNRIDWRGTPQRWYRPSRADYRRPADNGEDELSVVEIPKFTSETRLLRTLKGLAARGKAGTTEAAGVFLQITALPILYRRIVKERLECEEAEPFFATYFHPDELLPVRSSSARSFLYSADNLEKNLIALIEGARKRGRVVKFVTGPEAFEIVKKLERGKAGA